MFESIWDTVVGQAGFPITCGNPVLFRGGTGTVLVSRCVPVSAWRESDVRQVWGQVAVSKASSSGSLWLAARTCCGGGNRGC